ncbi:MAG: multicopper oxidase family protein [Rhizobiales bacterium]|nr:multicopper oxidase family protein [Hyphomicrobiales bacterium]
MFIADGISRRALLLAGGATLVGAALRPLRLSAATDLVEKQLFAGPGQAPLGGPSSPVTDVWGYNALVPGPEIRVRQHGRVRIVIDNKLPQDTTIHWHGVRVPNAMDGAPDVTQPPIPPGASFVYEFDVPDAGTYWYHPHIHSAEQVGRGLAGPFIVEELDPPQVDRDIVWVLGDFRLKKDGSIAGGFNNPMETGMSGRIGNTVTINGRIPEPLAVKSGERIRLRLINAAPSRIFRLEFRGHQPIVITYDGQPVEPHPPDDDRVILGPAMRIDLLLDMIGLPGTTAPILDSFYEGLPFKLVDLVYSDEASPKSALPPPTKLAANPIPEPDIARATRHEVTLTGGMGMGGMASGRMMGGNGMAGGMGQGGEMMAGMNGASMWMMNGVAMPGNKMGHMDPILTLTRNASYILAIDNQTAWYHPIHLHGHSFRVITRNGEPTKYREWRDTVLMPPREKAEVAFVADNPGDWMFHCHILDHQEGGMMSVLRVT